MASDLNTATMALVEALAALPDSKRLAALNIVRWHLHEISPMRAEPVDCVLWMPAEQIAANDYNPNVVAPPEMKLLERSIENDGYTQPIVVWHTEECEEVVDGFHRTRIGKESAAVRKRTGGYLPVTIINPDREGRNDRIAATIRHNRARGKHLVDGMSQIIQELARRNWSDKRIGKELGMEPDEVLRLKQITGLADLFADEEFSQAWEASGTRERPQEETPQ